MNILIQAILMIPSLSYFHCRAHIKSAGTGPSPMFLNRLVPPQCPDSASLLTQVTQAHKADLCALAKTAGLGPAMVKANLDSEPDGDAFVSQPGFKGGFMKISNGQ